MGERTRPTAVGGIGAMQLVARQTGLIEAIDESVHVLRRHLPYHESDHVLNIAYNALNGGTCLEDIELRRNDEVYLDALGVQRIPDPTTEGDFCRRFEAGDVECLMEAENEVRLRVWGQQPEAFFEEAVLNADGTLAETTGECKQGMDVAYNGTWGYHPLVISLFLGLVGHHRRRTLRELVDSHKSDVLACPTRSLSGIRSLQPRINNLQTKDGS